MTSQVYYRKWRPKGFAELVGQDPVANTLRQAVEQGRVAHAYLFCGPRGTGKTSTARILAKAVNCHNPQEGEPCNLCGLCQAFNEGRFLDLIELDAASNRGIDEIRNIRDKVHFAPSEGRRKVYIIDEAHMLTEHASNAFLKTLEEPPRHVIFVLCTTEPHKVLPTIISRCQRFDFRRLSPEVVMKRLQWICHEEGIEAEAEALRALARAASGSLRDGENLLEQMVVSYGNRVGMGEVREALGLGGGEEAMELVRHLLKGSAAEALATINRAVWGGLDVRQLHRQTVDYLRGLLVLQCGVRETLDYPTEVLQELGALGARAPQGRVIKALKRLGEVNLRYDTPSPLPLELAIVEACTEETPGHEPPRPSVEPPRSERPVPPISPATPLRQAPRPGAQEAPSEPLSQTEAAPGGSLPNSQWEVVVKALSRHKGRRFNIGALLRDCKARYLDGDALVLTFTHRSHLERMQEELEDPQCRRTVDEAFARALGSSHELRLTLADERVGNDSPASQSPLVRAALGLGARIVEEKEGDE